MLIIAHLTEFQSAAGRWRANCFESICKKVNPAAVTHRVNQIVQHHLCDSLDPLTKVVFGEGENIQLEQQHRDLLE
jgi:hypothetical protein